MTITVTQEHIAKGLPQRCQFCPIALAMKDALPGCETIRVFGTSATDGEKVWKLPPLAQDFIKTFDRHRTLVSPSPSTWNWTRQSNYETPYR